MRATKATINLKAIQNNLSVIRQLAPKSKIMAVVKADAYGHGIEKVALSLSSKSLLNHSDAIAVSCIDEAIQLREAKVSCQIVLLEGFFRADELPLIIALDLQIVIHQQFQLDALVKFSQQQANTNVIDVWLKLDSGMNRLGFSPEDFQQAYQTLLSCRLVNQIRLMSHLACADDIDHLMNKKQIDCFKQVTKDLSGEKSMANSAGIIAWPESHFEWVRPGIMLYGCSPMPGYQGSSHHLLPAMTLESELFAIREVKPGDTVGYSASWEAVESTRIGLVAIGYGDGYPRHAKQGTPVWINGRLYPLVGNVSMDMITVDLGNKDAFSLGDRVVLWGEELALEEVAKHAQTIAYTLLCGVTSRVAFEWIE